ncbi:hypothetical protein K493DRAFT_408895 [Basidiobolus meristosporus CBS 931.73]|uniref:BZIP domain-containing protein n=1 Tax=Basidiobolus meristosporus CBS 931.73 TaxID=1314790 RepID=A0A1Y1Y3Z1_9FUNG|nr:hypothetical protein K493DRAFT_408895 [Basidiobolus meristosporus CBS 931.73]|eukprot:ORX92304.1 hypothetical protein K493DRAFT_408895 [Basidiobolus meristosporus CBS 931.73]
MSETVTRLGIPRSDFPEDVGAPTPTRFLLECGEYRLTPSLSSLGEINPFEASFTTCGKKDPLPGLNPTHSTFTVPTSNVSTTIHNEPVSVAPSLSAKATMPFMAERQPYESSTSFIPEKLPQMSKPPASVEEYQDRDSSSDERKEPSSGSKRKGSTHSEKDEEKRKRFLERNRVAASKCRQKKKVWVKELEHKSDEITARNKQLQHIVGQLKEELLQLKSQLLGHRNCNCNVIQQYVQTSGHFSQVPDAIGGPVNTIVGAPLPGLLSTGPHGMHPEISGPKMSSVAGAPSFVTN